MRAPAELEVGACIQAFLAHSLAVVRDRSLDLTVKQAQVAAKRGCQSLKRSTSACDTPVFAASEGPDARLPAALLVPRDAACGSVMNRALRQHAQKGRDIHFRGTYETWRSRE